MSSCVMCKYFSFHCIRYNNVFYILGRYEDEFIEHRMNQLQSFVDRVSAHPVLNRYGKSTVFCKFSSFGTFLKKNPGRQYIFRSEKMFCSNRKEKIFFVSDHTLMYLAVPKFGSTSYNARTSGGGRPERELRRKIRWWGEVF